MRFKIALYSRLVSVPREEPGLFGSPPFAVRRGLSFSYGTKSFLAYLPLLGLLIYNNVSVSSMTLCKKELIPFNSSGINHNGSN